MKLHISHTFPLWQVLHHQVALTAAAVFLPHMQAYWWHLSTDVSDIPCLASRVLWSASMQKAAKKTIIKNSDLVEKCFQYQKRSNTTDLHHLQHGYPTPKGRGLQLYPLVKWQTESKILLNYIAYLGVFYY